MRWQTENALILYFPSILESVEHMNFAGSVFPLLRFGCSKAAEAHFIFEEHTAPSGRPRLGAECVTGSAAVAVRGFSRASGTEGRLCLRGTSLRERLVLSSQERECTDCLGSLVNHTG